MKFETISPKQAEIYKFLAEDTKTLICDGAVRTGKTVHMATAFIIWAMGTFNGALFGICGKTVRTTERNIIQPIMGLTSLNKNYKIRYTSSLNLMTISKGNVTNYFYVYGGKDESSYMLIQGITLSGILFDEVALMPRSFVEQALARTITIPNKKILFNCNPGSPSHWFYNEWILKAEERNAKHIHFSLEDNPALTPEQIEETKKDFLGVFYERYILGRWVAAEGLIYRKFAENQKQFLLDKLPDNLVRVVIGVDFGGTGSATTFSAVGFTERFQEAIVLFEERRKGALDDPETLTKAYVDFVKKVILKYPIARETYADSAEQVLIRGLRTELVRERIPMAVNNSLKNEIVDRIRLVNSLMNQGRFFIMEHCVETRAAFAEALWSPKSDVVDKRLDDGTTNIDTLDATEYAIEPLATVLQRVKVG